MVVNQIKDIIIGLRDHLIDNVDALTADNCKLGFPHDAVEDLGDMDSPFIEARVSVYDFAPAPELAYVAEPEMDVNWNNDPPTAALTKTPHPFRAYFQISIYTERVEDGHLLLSILPGLLSSRLEIAGPSSEVYDIFYESGESRDDLGDRGSYKTIRVSAPVWLPHAQTPEEITLVKTLILEINSDSITETYEQE